MLELNTYEHQITRNPITSYRSKITYILNSYLTISYLTRHQPFKIFKTDLGPKACVLAGKHLWERFPKSSSHKWWLKLGEYWTLILLLSMVFRKLEFTPFQWSWISYIRWDVSYWIPLYSWWRKCHYTASNICWCAILKNLCPLNRELQCKFWNSPASNYNIKFHEDC